VGGDAWNVEERGSGSKGKILLKGKNDFREEGSIKDKFWRFAVGVEGKVL
jgi:hypothetical protein